MKHCFFLRLAKECDEFKLCSTVWFLLFLKLLIAEQFARYIGPAIRSLLQHEHSPAKEKSKWKM